MLKTLSHSLLSLLYPQECELCGAEVRSRDDGTACAACWDRTRIFIGRETLCKKCGAFLFEAPSSSAESHCGKCEDQYFDRAVAAGIYEHALSASVLRLKRVPHVPARVKNLIRGTIYLHGSLDEPIVIPVPLSARRRNERGFNQAELLARIVAKDLGWRLDGHTLMRDIDTPMHRAGMDRKARAKTVKNVFRVSRPKLVAGKSVLLVDDVMTSGSTASVCARVLKKAGAATVTVLTIARAL